MEVWLTFGLCELGEWFRSNFCFCFFAAVQVCKKGIFKDLPQGTAVHLSVQITLILTLNQNFILFTFQVWFRGQFKGWQCSQVHTPHLIWISRQSFTTSSKNISFVQTSQKLIYFLVLYYWGWSTAILKTALLLLAENVKLIAQLNLLNPTGALI